MGGKLVKLLKTLLISIFSLFMFCLIFYGYKQYSFYNAAYKKPGYTWESSNPDIWFAVREDLDMKGEFYYNGKIIKIELGILSGSIDFLAVEADNDPELERLLNGKGRMLIGTSIHSCSKTKLVLDVDGSNLTGFNEKQIIFIRKD